MNRELSETTEALEKEKNTAEDTLIEATENSLFTTCKNHPRKADNVEVIVSPNTCDFTVYAEETVIENVRDNILEINLVSTKMLSLKYEVEDMIQIPLDSKRFGRIATQNAKNAILQKICEEGCKVLYSEYYTKEKDVMTGTIQRYLDRDVSINLGRVNAILDENEQAEGETFRPTERIKVYAIKVKNTPKGPRVSASRTHPDFVKRPFGSEVAEARDSTVEIKAIAREAGSRTKIVIKSNDSNADPVGACVGLDGARVSSIVNELCGEKVDIISWDDNPAYLIENALSPAKMICVVADEGTRETQVIVSDYQLPLAIGKEGQGARLAVRLTGFKIDIRSEAQTRKVGFFEQMGLQYGDAPAISFEEKTYEEPGSCQRY